MANATRECKMCGEKETPSPVGKSAVVMAAYSPEDGSWICADCFHGLLPLDKLINKKQKAKPAVTVIDMTPIGGKGSLADENESEDYGGEEQD